MTETTTAVPMDSQALFDAAIANDAPAPAEVTQEAPQTTEQAQPSEQQGQPRDEHGRFAPKESEAKPQEAAQTEQQPAAPQAAQDVIPPWRLREEAEARRSAEARAAQYEAQARQFQEQLRQLSQKPAEQIDPLLDPDKFLNNGVSKAIDPIRSELGSLREHYSRKDAIRTHGLETVQEAYKAFEAATRAGDPRIAGLVQRVVSGLDPFDDIVSWHKREKALTTVGDDPNAWFEKELARRAAADPQFAARFNQPAQSPQSAPATPNTIVKLPPSLNRAPGTQAPTSGGMSDADLYAHATG